MRITKRVTFPVALLFIAACGLGQDIHYNFDRGTNFAAYKTDQWVELSSAAQEVVPSIPAVSSSVIEWEVLPEAPEARVPSSGETFSSGNPSSTASTSSSTDVIPPPQSAREKFKAGFRDSFGYSTFLFVGITAGSRQRTNYYPAFHQGTVGFSRYYWRAFADQADRKLLVESLIPTMLHEDGRYYALGHGSFVKRTKYALTRAVITRNDNGDNTFNVAEVVGSGAAAGLSSAYYPSQYRTWTRTGERWLGNVALDSLGFVVREFWPDINHALVHRKAATL